MAYENPSFVARQYADASKVGARISLHERFSTNPYPWQRWVFDSLDLPERSHILEVGCGPGNLWLENRNRVPEGWRVTLTDVSPGMLRDAQERLGPDDRLGSLVADAQYLPLDFSLDNGGEQLSRHFSGVVLHLFEDALVVTGTRPFVEYLLSGRTSEVAPETAAEEFGRRILELEGRLGEELAARGSIRITKDIAMFLARK